MIYIYYDVLILGIIRGFDEKPRFTLLPNSMSFFVVQIGPPIAASGFRSKRQAVDSIPRVLGYILGNMAYIR